MAALAAAGLLAACGAAPAKTTPAAATAPATSLATSLATAQDSWAVVPVSANPAFWQVFVRPASSPSWQLVTPQGVADNGGLVAAGTGGSLTVAVRPDQGLTFSPLATTANGGARWSTGLIDAGLAAAPDALAASGSQLLALLGDGTHPGQLRHRDDMADARRTGRDRGLPRRARVRGWWESLTSRSG